MLLQKIDYANPSNWHNQYSKSSDKNSTEDEGLDDPMDKDNFPIFSRNANDIRIQLANLANRLYVVMLLQEEGRGRRIHTCQYTRPMRVDYYLNSCEDVMFDKVHMHLETFLQLSGLLLE